VVVRNYHEATRVAVPNGPQPKPKTAISDRGPSVPARIHGFLREVYFELKPPKTKWPTWQEARRLTMVVLSVIIVVAVYIGSLDYILTQVTTKLQLIK
jgi:preprotein translocase SecE subunit